MKYGGFEDPDCLARTQHRYRSLYVTVDPSVIFEAMSKPEKPPVTPLCAVLLLRACHYFVLSVTFL